MWPFFVNALLEIWALFYRDAPLFLNGNPHAVEIPFAAPKSYFVLRSR